MKYFVSLGSSLVLAAVPSVGATQVTHPAPGTAERKAIMDAVRPWISKDVGLPVKLKVNRLNEYRDWAFLNVTPVQPDGRPIEWSRSKYRSSYKGDLFHPDWTAFLHRNKKTWRFVDKWDCELSDVAWDGYDKKYHLPKDLFDLP